MERSRPLRVQPDRQPAALPRYRADVAPTAAKLGKQIKYADKLGIPYVWFPADASEEGAQDEVKNIITGDQRPADAQSWEPDTVYAQQTVTVEA